MSHRQDLLRLAACALLAGPSLANSFNDNDHERLALDLERLEAALAPQGQSSANIGYLLKSSFAFSPDDVYQPVTGDNLGGFRLQDASLWASASLGAFDVFIRADASDATDFPPIGATSGTPAQLNMRDAWARTNVTDEIQVYVGNFRCPVVNSGMLDEGKLLMVDRTRIGQLFDVYQPGAAAVGNFGAFHFKLAAQNGGDGATDEFGVVARAEYKIGDGAKQREGALGAEGFDATIGAGVFRDYGMGDDFEAFILDGYSTYNAFSLHAEVVDMGKDLANMALNPPAGPTAPPAPNLDGMPFTATLGFLVSENIELAVRYQDLDDQKNTTQIGGGLNYYVSGHAAKWQVNVSQFDNDVSDGLIFQVGLSLGSAFPNGAP